MLGSNSDPFRVREGVDMLVAVIVGLGPGTDHLSQLERPPALSVALSS